MWLKIQNYKNRIIENIIAVSFILYIIDIFLISNIPKSSIIRVQDIASIFAFVSIIYILKESKKTNKSYNKMLFFIALYLIYLIITNSIYYLIGNINIMSVFFIGKEIVYYLCFFIVSYLLSCSNNKYSKTIEIILVITLIYGIYFMAIGKISYYGIGTIFESAPSVSGAIYFVTSIYSYYIYKSQYTSRFKYYSLISYLLTLFTVSKTNIIGLTLFYLLYFGLELMYYLFSNLRRKKDDSKLISTNKILGIITLLLLSFIAVIFIINIPEINDRLFSNVLIEKVLNRFNLFGNSYLYRFNKSSVYLDYFTQNSDVAFLFGRGKGVAEFIFNTSTLAVDNQFVRIIIEMGAIGFLLWLLPIILVILNLKINKERYIYHMGMSLFLSYLVMGVGYEVFVVTKSGIIFWFLLGLFLGDIKSNKTQQCGYY